MAGPARQKFCHQQLIPAPVRRECESPPVSFQWFEPNQEMVRRKYGRRLICPLDDGDPSGFRVFLQAQTMESVEGVQPIQIHMAKRQPSFIFMDQRKCGTGNLLGCHAEAFGEAFHKACLARA